MKTIMKVSGELRISKSGDDPSPDNSIFAYIVTSAFMLGIFLLTNKPGWLILSVIGMVIVAAIAYGTMADIETIRFSRAVIENRLVSISQASSGRFAANAISIRLSHDAEIDTSNNSKQTTIIIKDDDATILQGDRILKKHCFVYFAVNPIKGQRPEAVKKHFEILAIRQKAS